MEQTGHFYLSIFLRFLPCWNVIKYSNLINKLNLFRWERLNWTFNIRYFYLFVFSREREKILETPSVWLYRAGLSPHTSHSLTIQTGPQCWLASLVSLYLLYLLHTLSSAVCSNTITHHTAVCRNTITHHTAVCSHFVLAGQSGSPENYLDIYL